LDHSIAILFILFMLLGAIPVIVSFAQLLLVGLHGIRNHYRSCQDITPRVAILVPAWNEGNVIGTTVDTLMKMEYPDESLKIYVVDDASTDDTPVVLSHKMSQYPDRVFHLRRKNGGQGKSHTLNYGLSEILAEEWAEAILIMDADVLFESDALRKMTRHLADPKVGAVTAYIKEGSSPGNLITRFIAFEYIAAQAAARRAQNVIGVLACMAGGAQLHTRANLIAIGGKIDTSSLAEDTYTTIETQLIGNRALFDGNAVVWAEEPDSLNGLWKQRMRWARGNLQLTMGFRHLWFHPIRYPGLGGIFFGLLWFSIVLMPVFMVAATIGIIGFYFLKPDLALVSFKYFWGVNALIYLFSFVFSVIIDPHTGRRAWFEGLMFPGLISILFMILSVLPLKYVLLLNTSLPLQGRHYQGSNLLLLFMYSWNSLCMVAAWLVYRLEKLGVPHQLRDAFLLIVGYGPLLCTITVAAMLSEWRKSELQWDKTEKMGNAKILK